MNYLNGYILRDVITRSPSTHLPAAADSAPTYAVFVGGNDTPIKTGTLTARSSTTGHYRLYLQLLASDGFTEGTCYILKITATVATVTDSIVIPFEVEFDTADLADITIDNLNAFCGNADQATNLTLDILQAALVNAPILNKAIKGIGFGVVGTGSTTTSIVTSAMTPAGAVADQFKNRVVTFASDTTTPALRGQTTNITASTNAANPTLTVAALTTAPASTDTFVVT